MKKTFTVIEAPGSKRTSPRNYTHAVIGQFNHAKRIAEVDVIYDQDLTNFDYYAKRAQMKAGDLIHVTGCATPWSYPINQEEIDKAKAQVAKYGNRDNYAAMLRADRVKIAKDYEAEVGDAWQVLRWSMSYANACKGHTEFPSCKNIKVVPTKEVTK